MSVSYFHLLIHVIQAIAAITDTTSRPTQEKIDRITSTLFPSDWFKAHPNYQNYVPLPKEPLSPQIIKRQQEATINWFSTGTCNALSNITQPTLLIVGADDMLTVLFKFYMQKTSNEQSIKI